MILYKVKDFNDMSNKILEEIINCINIKPDACISFTTGRTTKQLLKDLAFSINGGLNIEQATFCNLDEFVGDPSQEYSVHSFMRKYLYNNINYFPKNIFMLKPDAVDKEAEILRYKNILKDYPRDIQILGLGVNGHIGANEPGTSFEQECFIADSHEETIKSTMELFNLSYDNTPNQMYTMGIKEIMDARCVILAASGFTKAKAVKEVIEGEITSDIPASYLKKHSNFILIVDEAACSLLALK